MLMNSLSLAYFWRMFSPSFLKDTLAGCTILFFFLLALLGFEYRALCLPGRHSTTWAMIQVGRYIILSWELFCFKTCDIFPFPPGLRASAKKSAVSLIGKSSNVTWYFSLADFGHYFFVLCFWQLGYIIFYDKDLFWSCLFGVFINFLYIDVHIFPKIRKAFCYYFIKCISMSFFLLFTFWYFENVDICSFNCVPNILNDLFILLFSLIHCLTEIFQKTCLQV
jgi:hypothetical protein